MSNLLTVRTFIFLSWPAQMIFVAVQGRHFERHR